MKLSKTEKYIIAVVVSLIIVCIGLSALASFVMDEDEKSIQLDESGYTVKPFSSAAEVLEIELIIEWADYVGDEFTLALPQRLRVLSDDELQNMLRTASTPGTVHMLALDTDSAANGVNVTVGQIMVETGMTPDEYVSGVADEMKAAQFTVDDVSAFQLGGKRVGRLVYSRESAQAGSLTGVQFAFARNQEIWIVTGTGVSSDFEDWLPVFQAIARTFEVVE